VTVSGNDAAPLTLQVARALAMLPSVFRARFVIGSPLADRDRIARTVVALKPGFETIEGADDLSVASASSDIAIATFGSVAFELAASGVPTLYLALTQEDVQSAAAFEQAGVGISLGPTGEASEESIAHAVKLLLSDPERRRTMRAAALTTIDANGARRVAADLAALTSQRLTAARKATSA
jgi:spore coat polysaccharide biosynthesis protein SpsF